MCPGGHIINSCCNKNTIVTNGMSYNERNNIYANSAILVQVQNKDIMYGLNYIDKIEKKAFDMSCSYKAPAMNIKDFINDTLNPLIFKSSYKQDTYLSNVKELFSDEVNNALLSAFMSFDTKIKGFIDKGIIVAPETKSSSTVRILRKANFQSFSHTNLYPIGEGAGYAGGIMSSALDGFKAAEIIIDDFTNNSF